METTAETTAEKVENTIAASIQQPAEEPVQAPVAPVAPPTVNQDTNMTVALNGMVDFEHRFKKREPKSKQIPLNITPTVQEQLQFLVDKNMIKSRNDFIFQLVESALSNIFSNPEIRNALNETQKWEK